jgi:pyruvate kinase
MSPLPDPVIELHAIAEEFNGVDRVTDRVLGDLPPTQLPSAMNLLHYLVLRSHDLRDTQRTLATDGLSSLGRMESHVHSGLHAVLRSLHLLAGVEPPAAPERAPLTLDDGEALLALHTGELFGPSPDGRSVRIMVTAPAEAATDYELVRDLLAAGMDCMRINCAHDGPPEWLQMIEHLKRATAETGRACRVCMDVGGPKLRTCAIEPGPAVQKLKPARDAWGRVTFPAVVCIVPAYVDERDRVPADAELVIDGPPPASLMPGDWIHFIDARGRRRRLRVLERRGDAVLTTLDRTAYMVPGTELRMPSGTEGDIRRVAEVPVREQALTLHVGDVLVLTPEGVPGRPAIRDNNGDVVLPAQVGVSLAEIFRDARPGEEIWFDD